MNREDIIRMAKKAGIGETRGWFNCVEEELERFANLIAAAEREECAKICEEEGTLWGCHYAAKIRARGKE